MFDVCGKAFARGDALKNHTRTNTHDKPIEVLYNTLCGKAF